MLKLSHHKTTSRGYVTHKGKRYYVPGRWPADQKKPPLEMEAAYRLLVRQLLGDPTVVDLREQALLSGDLTMSELCSRYLKYSQVEEDPRTFAVMKGVVRALLQFSAHLPAKDFGPLKLQAFRDHLIRVGYDRPKSSTGEVTHHEYTRSGINYFTKRVRKIFRWGVTQELITAERSESLRAILPLREGRTKAPEAREIRQVPDEIIAQTLPHLSPPIAAMVKLQRLTAMRPGEVCNLSMPEIDRTDPTCWVYVPKGHKTAHMGKHRVIVFTADAQAVLLPWLREDGKPLFSPADRMAARKHALRENRKSPVQQSQVNRAVKNPQRYPGDRYSTYSFGRSISKACKSHGIPSWSPNQVRKRAGQWILEQEGHAIEDAAAILGNDPAVARKFYLQQQTEKAKAVMLRIEEAEKKSPPSEIPSPPGEIARSWNSTPVF